MFDFFKKNPNSPNTFDVVTSENGTRSIISRNDEVVPAKENNELMEYASKESNIPIFRGQIKHLYESDFTENKDKCPNCSSELVRMFSNFGYATQKGARLMTAPAGLFCPNCPTVVIDDDMILENIDRKRFEYYGTFSVEDGVSEFSVIDSINGEKPVFIKDEEEIGGLYQSVHQPEDSMYIDSRTNRLFGSEIIDLTDSDNFGVNKIQPDKVNALRNQKAKKKAKNKQASKSKKANRKK
jgi:hypothetical protein